MTEKGPESAPRSQGWWQEPPRWLGRGVVLVLAMVAAFQVVMWLFNRPIQRWLHASQAAVSSAAKRS